MPCEHFSGIAVFIERNVFAALVENQKDFAPLFFPPAIVGSWVIRDDQLFLPPRWPVPPPQPEADYFISGGAFRGEGGGGEGWTIYLL